jgi:hypothetical protein
MKHMYNTYVSSCQLEIYLPPSSTRKWRNEAVKLLKTKVIIFQNPCKAVNVLKKSHLKQSTFYPLAAEGRAGSE